MEQIKRANNITPKSIRMPNEIHKLLQLISKVEGISLGTLLSNIGEVYAKQHHPDILKAIEEQTEDRKKELTKELLQELK